MARLTETRNGVKLGLMPTIFATVAALYFAQAVLVPLAVAVLLGFVLAPAVTWLERFRVGRIAAVLIAVGVALAVLGAVGWTVERQFVEVAEKLPDYGVTIQSKLHRFRGAAGGSFSKAAKGVEDTMKSIAGTQPSLATTGMGKLTTAAQPPNSRPGEPGLPQVSPQNPLPVREYSEPSSSLQIVGHYLGQLLGPLATSGLIVVFLIFMLLNRRDLRDRMIRLVGHGRLNLTTQALDDAATRISRYLLMQSVINVSYGICVGIGLWIIGLSSAEGRFPNVLVWALLAAVLRFVPYLGPIVAAAVPVILSFAIFNSAAVFAATLGMYVAIELVIANVLEPWLLGSSTGLSIMAILVSAVFWTWLWGPIGLLLATPLTVIVVVLGKYVPHLSFFDVLLGDEQALEPFVRVYQRLLSMDQEEAGELLHDYRKDKGLEFVYDQIMIPALVMAAKDRHLGQLDTERQVFIHQAMRDLIEELGEAQSAENATAAPAEAEAQPGSAASVAQTPIRPSNSGQPIVNVLCLPAHGEADELVGLMLAQLLELKGQPAIAASQVSLTGEVLELVQTHDAGAVCISALPPAALTHSRYLCKRLCARFPELPLVAGLWTSNADRKKALARLPRDGAVSLTTTLGAAIAEIHQLIQPVLIRRARENAKVEAQPQSQVLAAV
ncbi:MAG TPA: AI-2E family transporter [Humisphaera sp.]|jgi:predicted PurR-regulated permease PerM|nr:AI-2E family transporter [Humisphaera sp.]